ncbi:unnamed protein product [Arctia plantaginis]|uniref:Uncharacterized protein n=1 Tax=Arctia plantaginis TaxID=874455 RepID=A0A8S0ZCK5_ARCPL|nr:unnamed protein product [Arctia plantaginis]
MINISTGGAGGGRSGGHTDKLLDVRIEDRGSRTEVEGSEIDARLRVPPHARALRRQHRRCATEYRHFIEIKRISRHYRPCPRSDRRPRN